MSRIIGLVLVNTRKRSPLFLFPFLVLIFCIIYDPMVDTGMADSVYYTIPVSLHPIGVAYYPSGHSIYVANSGSHTVSVILSQKTIPVGTNPYGVAFDSANGNIYVANLGSNNVTVISGSTNTVITTIPVGITPDGVGFDSTNGNIYVANYGSNTVSVISGSHSLVTAAKSAGEKSFASYPTDK
jgi:YVTN family beta-propeller protein